MGYRFSLILNREVSEQETAQLRGVMCAGAQFVDDQLPTNADVPVTKVELDDESAATLAEAIQAAMDAVHEVEGLTIPGLSVPAQPAGPVDADAALAETADRGETVDATT